MSGWYWLDVEGLDWVREHLPEAKIVRHARLRLRTNSPDQRDCEAVQFPKGGRKKTKAAGFKAATVAAVETICAVCKRSYLPFVEHDPCIRELPGVAFACCGHGKGPGYVSFHNGIAIRFAGPEAIGRSDGGTGEFHPDDEAFWKATGRLRS